MITVLYPFLYPIAVLHQLLLLHGQVSAIYECYSPDCVDLVGVMGETDRETERERQREIERERKKDRDLTLLESVEVTYGADF